MTVTSLGFLLFLLAGMVIYYIVPGKVQWVILVGLSLAYYYFAATPWTIVYLLLSVLIAYVATNAMEKYREKAAVIRVLSLSAILLNVLIWFVVKGSSFWLLVPRLISHFKPSLAVPDGWQFGAALGMGYYTAQVIGYILDVSWENEKAQRNFLKLFLFVGFFPQLTVGPISRYGQLQSLYERHSFSYHNLCYGSQRILWGFFKKLVISDRVATLNGAIWADTATYQGFWLWVAVFCYGLQIYTDFSGCMDIVLGAAQLFDITLPENFCSPFFARNVQEFWQRWHMTLGAWARDYIYYPVLKSSVLQRTGKWAKKHFSKKTAKLIPWSLGMGVLWFVMGFWHGSTQHIFGISLWFWCVLVISEITAPFFKKVTGLLKVDAQSMSWHLFQSVRTYVIYSLGCVFFTSSSLKGAWENFRLLFGTFGDMRPWQAFDETILSLGLGWGDVNLILFGMLVLFVTDLVREKYGDVRDYVAKQILPFRWICWILLLLLVVIYGRYGAGYDASAFIYEGF